MFGSSFLLFAASDFLPPSLRVYAKNSYKNLTISLKDRKVVAGCTWINSLEHVITDFFFCLVSMLLNLKLLLETALVGWPGIYSTGVSSRYRNRNQETLL